MWRCGVPGLRGPRGPTHHRRGGPVSTPGAVEGGAVCRAWRGVWGSSRAGAVFPGMPAGVSRGSAGFAQPPAGRAVASADSVAGLGLGPSRGTSSSHCGLSQRLEYVLILSFKPSDFHCSEQTKPNLVCDVLSHNNDGWPGFRCGGIFKHLVCIFLV